MGPTGGLTNQVPATANKKPFPAAPSSLYLASGHHGQMIAIIPEQELVLVRTGFDKEADVDRNKIFELVMKSLEASAGGQE